MARDALGASIARTCELARYLESRIAQTPELELAAPVELNIVCFRYRAEEAHRVNARIAVELQESGVAAPSTTVLAGKLAIRAAIVNHRTLPVGLGCPGGTDGGDRPFPVRTRAAQSSASASNADASNWPPRLAREAALRELEDRIAAEPEALGLRRDRARLLTELGRTLEARNAYLDILTRAPSDRVALNNLGTLLHATGYRTAARTAYAEAAARHPDDPMSHVNLANVLYARWGVRSWRASTTKPLCATLRTTRKRTRVSSYVLAELGDAARRGVASPKRLRASRRACLAIPRRGPTGIAVAVDFGARRQHPDRNFLDDRVFETTVVASEFYDLHAAAAAPSTDIQRHRRCGSGRARAHGCTVRGGPQQCASTQPARRRDGHRAS